MFIWTAIDVDYDLKEQKEIIKGIEREIDFKESNVSLLPLHISLKISTEIKDIDELIIRNDLENYYKSINSFEIELDKIELNNSIVWIKMKENNYLKEIHENLCLLFNDKYGIEPYEFDKSFIYHTTLFLDSDLEKVNAAYLKIKNMALPKKIIAKSFIIGSSQSGNIGTYKVDNRIFVE